MKYIYFLVIPLFIYIGCSSSDSEQKNKDMMKMKKSIDSLKALNNSYNKTLDSLKESAKTKEDELRFFQQELDSVQKNMKEVEEMK